MRELSDTDTFAIFILCATLTINTLILKSFFENMAFIEAGYTKVIYPNGVIDWGSPKKAQLGF